MRFGIDDLVTLDNGKKYYLIDKLYIDDIGYYYAVLWNDEIDEMIEGEYCFFEECGEYLYDVEDDGIKAILIDHFMKNVVG